MIFEDLLTGGGLPPVLPEKRRRGLVTAKQCILAK
jgi:hypothetical protein